MSDESKAPRVDDVAFYLHLRSRLEHEDGLIVNRLSWLMASEALFFSAYAIALNGAPTREHIRLLHLIPLVAIVSSVLIFVGILSALRGIGWLQRLLEERVREVSHVGLPPLHTPGAVKGGQVAPLLLPVVFIAVWLYILAG
jgi:hypothetical protein